MSYELELTDKEDSCGMLGRGEERCHSSWTFWLWGTSWTTCSALKQKLWK